MNNINNNEWPDHHCTWKKQCKVYRYNENFEHYETMYIIEL